MAYTKVEYNPVNWKNKSEGLITPLDKRNLNNMDGAIKTLADSLDVAYNELDTKKLSVDGSYKIISETPTWDEKTGILRFKFYDGTEFMVDFNVEKIPVSFSMNENGVITMTTEDGTKWTADIGSLTPNYVYDDNERIAVTTSKAEDGSTHVSFDLKKGSITNDYLANDYLASIIAETVKAQTASSDAKKSADSASESASNASASAKTATDAATSANTSETNAKKSADSASNSATSASLSETNAKKSADSASTSAASASNSATSASTSENNARVSANSASASASSASTSETNAKKSADSAITSANNASTSENNASASETNAKKYYEQTKSISESFAGTLRPKGTVTFANLPSVSLAETGDMYNVSDEFTTTTDFAEGAGNTIPLGSNVYKNSDGKWDVLAGSPVTGVKGREETSYRRGNVNITKENIGLGNVDNTADSEKRVSYATSAGSADSATKSSNDSANQKITSTYIKGVGIKNHTVTVTKGDGTSSSFEVPDTDTNTTYSLKKTGSKIQLVGSDGSTTEVTDDNTTYDLDAMINALPVGTDDPVDNDYYVSQYADGGTSNTGYFRRPVSKLWNYIKTKLATVATSGSYTDLSNKPTIGNGKVTVNQNGTTKGTFTMNQTGDTIINLTDSDTNTWRDVVDGLDSTRTDASLSANQGKVLNEKFASYLPLSGGTITGRIVKNTSGSWVGDRDRAVVYSMYPGDDGYGCVACMPTKNGSWSMGNLGGVEHLIFNYVPDANYSANKNESIHVYLRPTEGTIALTKDIPTSLPASDVYEWAKASSKPSYSWGEISGRPTALSSFTNDSGFITGISKSMVTDALGYTPALIRPSTFHGTMGTSSGDGGRIGTATFEIPKDKSGKSVRIIHLESNYSLTTCSSPSTSGTTVTVNVHSDTITSGNPSFGGRVLYVIEGEF
jgi:hypothetical protein